MDTENDQLYWANVAAEELGAALAAIGTLTLLVEGDEDGDVNVTFAQLRDAETMLALSINGDGSPGTIYDRAAGSCPSITELSAHGDLDEATYRDLVTRGWTWQIHPHMSVHRVDWHVHVSLPAADANHVTASLRSHLLGGAS